MLQFTPLASGSKGNCIYLSTPKVKLLIDCGISGKATQEKLKEINVDIADIDAVIVTHEHIDHIRGLKVLANRLKIPIFANHETAKNIASDFKVTPKFKIFTTGEPFEFGELKFHPFTIPHDASDPVGFTIECQNDKVGICTDLGFVTSLVKQHLQKCDILYLEANHDPQLVLSCPRPMTYKQRVLGRSGHLSNEACGSLLSEIYSPKLKQVYLAHLSEDCNSPDLALDVVKKMVGKNSEGLSLSIAHQRMTSPSFLL